MEVGILGPLTIRGESGRLQPISAAKERAVVTVLALACGRPTGLHRIVDLVWGEHPPSSAQVTVRSLISRLRGRLGTSAVLSEVQGQAYRLAVSPDSVDAGRFAAAASKARTYLEQRNWSLAGEYASTALEEWRGAPLADLADGPASWAERSRLEELRIATIELRCDALLASGRHGDVLAELQTRVVDHPFHERFWAQLMLALYHTGRQSEALGTYQRVRAVLAEELGLEPGPGLRELEASILSQDGRLSRYDALKTPTEPAPAERAPALRPEPFDEDSDAADPTNPLSPRDRLRRAETNLVPPASTLAGRSVDLHAVRMAVQQHPLVTLTGPGGVGKTRLAVHSGIDLLDTFDDGVWMVDLSTTNTPDTVANVIATVLSVSLQIGQDPMLDLAKQLADRRSLIILDNCEHLLPAAATAAAVLTASAGLHVIATSREALRVDGEVVYIVAPLDTSDAVTLFNDRAARMALPSPSSQETVAEICRRLDGLPLAIELAAASMALRSDTELLETLGRGEFRGGLPRRDRPDRHRDLRTVVTDSYTLLPESAQRLFRRLATFAGDADLPALSRVCSAGPDGAEVEEDLEVLVAASMVVVAQRGGRTRFRLLETMRMFARVWLAEDLYDLTETQRRHGAWAAELVAAADVGLRTQQERHWYQQLDLEFDEIRTAFDRAIDRDDVDLALALVAPLQHYAIFRVRPELFAMAGRIAGHPRASGEHAARALALTAWGAFASLNLPRALDLAEQALRQGSSTYTTMVTESMRAAALCMLGDVSQGRSKFAQLMAQARELSDPYWLAFLTGYGMSCRAAGVDLGAEEWLEAGLRAAAASGVSSLHAFLAVGQGYASVGADTTAAVTYLRRGAALAEAAGCTYLRDYARAGLTALEGHASARDIPGLIAEAQRWISTGDHFQALVHLLGAADALEGGGDAVGARQLRAAAGELSPDSGGNPAAFRHVLGLAVQLASPNAQERRRESVAAAED